MRSYEKGTRYEKEWQCEIITAYDQPVHNVIVAWLYHAIWEKLTWRIWRWLERFQPKVDTLEDFIKHEPFTCRQDERCYFLTHKNRIDVGTSYGDRIPRKTDGEMSTTFLMTMNIKPWCTCHATGKWLRQDGYVLDRPSGLWVHSRCRKPSKMNYDRMVAGSPQIPQTRKNDDIYAIERNYEARKVINEELSWVDDEDEDDMYDSWSFTD